MSNPFFNAFGNGAPNLAQMLQRLKSNPIQMLMQRRFNVPQDMANDANAMLQHLVNTGQVTQEQVNKAYQTAQHLTNKPRN